MITILFSAFIFFATPVFGVIEPPHKSIEYCYRIDNISAFPNFVLIARFPNYFGGHFDPFVQLKENECFSRSTRDEIVAVRQDRFHESGMEMLDYAEQSKEVGYFDSHPDVFHSGIRVPLSPVKVYNLEDPRKKIEDIFTIDALNDQKFSLRLAKKIVQRDNGIVEEKVYATAEEGIADPPGPGYEYTDEPITVVENPESIDRVRYYRDPLDQAIIFFNVGVVLAIAISALSGPALFSLARRFAVRRRWRAWIPIVNLSLFVRLAGKRQWWFFGLLVIPLLCLILIMLATPLARTIEGREQPYWESNSGQVLAVKFVFALGVAELGLLMLLCTHLAVRCGRPWWWGPLMVLVPPVGLVLLGIMAWSKKSNAPVNLV